MTHSFKRDVYFETEKAINRFNITVILGAKGCGKTTCMKQLADNLPNAVYVNMDADFDTDDQRRKFVDRVVDDIQHDKEITYLIDDVQYMALPDKEIAKIMDEYDDAYVKKTKVVFTGNPSNALECWGHKSCSSNTAFIRTGFLSYPEWLAYKGITEVSEKTYVDFITNTREFYKSFKDTKTYLQACLDDADTASNRAVEYIVGSPSEELDVWMLLNVLNASVMGNPLNDIPPLVLKHAMRFLVNSGLITLTYISDELTAAPNIVSRALKESDDLYREPWFSKKLGITINHPMFYLDLAKDEPLDNVIKNHIRGLLPLNGVIKYHNVDFVTTDRKAISVLADDSTALDALPDDYRKILVTRNATGYGGAIKYVPYYHFIYNTQQAKTVGWTTCST